MTAALEGAASPRADDGRDHDARIVLAIRAGSRAAEAELYERHAGSVLRLATRLLRCTDDARDVLQDTFLRAYQELPTLREPAAVRPWLHTVCVRLVHRRYRKRKLLRLLGLDRGQENARLEWQISLDASPEVRAEIRSFDRALDQLPPEEKIAWVLHRIEGCTLEEVAAVAGCSLATTKRRIAAAEQCAARYREERSS